MAGDNLMAGIISGVFTHVSAPGRGYELEDKHMASHCDPGFLTTWQPWNSRSWSAQGFRACGVKDIIVAISGKILPNLVPT